jgi:CRP-like cAMP-binding protein
MTPPAHLHLALQSDEWFADCSPALQGFLLQAAKLRKLGDGEMLFTRGDEAGNLYCGLGGSLTIGATHAGGGASMLAHLEPYQWFGEISLIDGQPRTHNAVARDETTVLVVPKPDLLGWLASHPDGWRDMARLACRKLRTAFLVLEEWGQLSLEQRLARRLWLLAQGYGSRRDQPRRRVRVGQEAIAQMLGVSRQSANKALQALEQRGLIRRHYGEVELLDLQALNPGNTGA